MGVIRAAQKAGVDREQSIKGMGDEELEKWVRAKMYDPMEETRRVEEEVKTWGMSNSNGVNGTAKAAKSSHL